MAVESTYWSGLNVTPWGAYLDHIEAKTLDVGMGFAQGPMALDFGCGDGRWSTVLHDHDFCVTGIDADAHAVDVCRKRLPNDSFICTPPDSERLYFPDATHDLVNCIEVHGVVHEPWFIAECARILNPNGLVVMTVLNRSSWRRYAWEISKRRRGETVGGEAAMYHLSYAALRAAWSVEGFTPLYECGLAWAPFSRTSRSKMVGPFVRLETALSLDRWVTASPWVAVVMGRNA